MCAKLYISKLPENAKPGDLLGAIANEADIDGSRIGEIKINGSVATVSVPEDIAKGTLENLEKVSGQSVNIGWAEEETKAHFLELARMVELERQSEMEKHEREIRSMSGQEREDEGRAILHLRGKDEGTGLGGKDLIKFMRQRQGEPLPENEISVGDLVMLSKDDPLRDDNPSGTVAEKTNYSITVAFDTSPSGFLYGKGLRCDLYVNDITYQRQLEALNQIVENPNSRLKELVEKSLGNSPIEFGEDDKAIELLDKNLNQSQKTAVEKSLMAEDFFLIHGPPGTGKTVTCIETARQSLRRGESVLCAADSNTAVDNLVEWLAKEGEKVVRIGHPARVTPTLREHTLDEIIQENEKYQKSQELREKAMELVDEQDNYTHPGGRWRRGMGDEMIKSLAKKGKGSRGVPPDKIKEMTKWLEMQEEIDSLFEKVESLEDEAIDEIIEWADVVCATNSGCGSEMMSGREFDTVIIDEATQATEPSCWIPIVMADKIIMAGDHKQLPPTILNQEAKGLSRTLFESLVDEHGDEIRSVLKIQYRMNKKIMNFSNREFYDGILKANESVAKHTLKDLITNASNSENFKFLGQKKSLGTPITFIDTSNIEAPERSRAGSNSKENPKEAEIVFSIASKLQKLGIDPRDIAVITPYDDQVDLIRKRIKEEGLEVDTVDGFQGREKEVVILSLVRSNKENEVGFLEDIRRLNVSLTRAKRKLIIVGGQSTVGKHEIYAKLIKYISNEGEIISA